MNGKVIAKSLKTSDPDEARAIMARMSVPRAGLEERETLRKIQSVMTSTLADVSEQMKAVSIPVGDLFRLFSEAPNRNEVGERTLNVYGGQFNVLADWIRTHHPEITNARDQALGSHLTELNTTQAECTHVTFRTTCDLATVVQTNRACVLRQGLETDVVTILEELCTLSSIFSHQLSALYLAGFH